MKLIADVALFYDGQVLLVRYKDSAKYNNQTGWFLPDDALAEYEHPDDAARRILKEQVGLELPPPPPPHNPLQPLRPALVFIESFKGSDKSWHLIFHYRLDLDEATYATIPDLQASLETHPLLVAAGWFKLDDLPPRKDVAHKGWALETLKRLQNNPG